MEVDYSQDVRSFFPILKEYVFIPGPVGPIEAIVEVPACTQSVHVAIICHPNPLNGGSLNSRLVKRLANAFTSLNIPTLRFNFRGTGMSTGTHDFGLGERDDLLAVIDYVYNLFRSARIILAGHSFGSYVALKTADSINCDLLYTVSLPTHMVYRENVTIPSCKWIAIHGEMDDVACYDVFRDWVDTLEFQPELKVFADADHHFRDQLAVIDQTVADTYRQVNRLK